MGLNFMSLLTPSKAPIYGIIPGNSSTPIGSVTLPVTFGTEKNFQMEHIKFTVADFGSWYLGVGIRSDRTDRFGSSVSYKFQLVENEDRSVTKIF